MTVTDLPLSKVKVCKVVGVTFVPAYPLNLLHLADMANRCEAAGERLPVELVRNPANEYDPNAVEVHVPALGDRHRMIGHIARDQAASLAPRMDAGEQFVAEVSWCRVDPNHTDRPGIDIAVARILDQPTVWSYHPDRFSVYVIDAEQTSNGGLLARSRRNRRGR